MITPRFSLEQDPKSLTIKIRAPYCNIKELEIYVEGNDFRFVCAPYYLRLNLPGSILDNDQSSGQFAQDTGAFTLKYAKANAGEVFENLEFITSLLSQRKVKKSTPEIEVIEDDAVDAGDTGGDEWSIDQTEAPPDGPDVLDNPELAGIKGWGYGFANQKSNLHCEEEFVGVYDIRGAQKLSQIDRKHLKNDLESMDFNADHYIADYFDDNAITAIISQPFTLFNQTTVGIEVTKFTDTERDFLKDLPNKEYLLTEHELENVLYGLVDILYAYCYDKHTTDLESCCESGWTITKLSSTLSCFYTATTIRELLISNYRRSLIYPLYRNFRLSEKIHEDLCNLLQKGQVAIIKCLIDIYGIFTGSAEPRYILNDLYVRDYIIFMQKCPKAALNAVINKTREYKPTADELNLNLGKLIENQLKEVNAADNILEKMSKLNLSRIQSDSESEDSSDDDDEDTDTDTSSEATTSEESSTESETNPPENNVTNK